MINTVTFRPDPRLRIATVEVIEDAVCRVVYEGPDLIEARRVEEEWLVRMMDQRPRPVGDIPQGTRLCNRCVAAGRRSAAPHEIGVTAVALCTDCWKAFRAMLLPFVEGRADTPTRP